MVGAFLQAYGVMAAFRGSGELLRLRDVVSRTGLPKGTAFRLLYTLRSTGFVEKVSDNQYRLRIAMPKKTRYRLGYAMNGKEPFTRAVTESLAESAEEADVELIIVDNKDDPETTLRNADSLIREHSHLIIQFQGDQSIAGQISTKFMNARIPMIAVDVPHPGAFYFGANNYQAGLIGGRHMGRWAALNWDGIIPEVVFIGYARAGSIPQSRMKGMSAGFRQTWAGPVGNIVELDSIGDFDSAFEAVRHYLNRIPPRKTMIGAVNDAAALAALRAFEEAGRGEYCAVMGQGAGPHAREELRRAGSRFIGSVAYFPETYGRKIITIARKILGGFHSSPAAFTKHVLITPENIDRRYPIDLLTTYQLRKTSVDLISPPPQPVQVQNYTEDRIGGDGPLGGTTLRAQSAQGQDGLLTQAASVPSVIY